jgi:hypothetical protein
MKAENMTNKPKMARLAKLKELKEKQAELIARQKHARAVNPIFFYQPLASSCRVNPYQQKIHDMFHAGKRIVVEPAPNKIGKTGQAACIVASWCLGYEPWNQNPDGSFVKSSLNVKGPVRGRITGESWEHHIGEVVIPELKKWIPEGMYTTKKNNVGVEASWKFQNGATLEFLTHSMELKEFESWRGHFWWADEPPSQKIFSAMSRGLMLDNGCMLMTMTPLSEPWVLDELVLSERPDVGILRDVIIWDNPMLYDPDVALLRDCGLSDAEIVKHMNLMIEWAWDKSNGSPPVLEVMG